MSARVNLSQAIIWFFRTAMLTVFPLGATTTPLRWAAYLVAMLTVFPSGATTNDKTLWTVKAFLPYGRTLKTGMQDVF